MIQHSSNEVALTIEATPSIASRGKHLAKMAGAAVLSFGLVGTFALPAYASVDDDLGPENTQSHVAQSLTTGDVELTSIAGEDVNGKVDAEILAEADAAETVEVADAESAETPLPSVDVPSGEGAAGIAAAALAQLGVAQDCTALVENALRAVGIPAGDLGTYAAEYVALGGTQVAAGSYAVGDILIYEGNHVAVYIGNGRAVHGGWTGYTTAIAGTATWHGEPTSVVRF